MRHASPNSRIARALADVPLVQTVFQLADQQGVSVYLVGGTVRDLLLGIQTHDLDFAVDGDGLRVARAAADALRGAYVPLDTARRTGRVVLMGEATRTRPFSAHHIDFASFRGGDLEADLRDRDFTLNAMAVALGSDGTPALIDPLNGDRDLRERLLRASSPQAFISDPVRLLRAVRQSAQFGCAIDPQTRSWLSEAAPRLATVSAERVRDEWFKILDLPAAWEAIVQLRSLGLLYTILPPLGDLEQKVPAGAELVSHAIQVVRAIDDLWAAFQGDAALGPSALASALSPLLPYLHAWYANTVCDERTRLALLRCAALLHGVGSALSPGQQDAELAGAAVAAQVARRWRCSNAEREMLVRTVRGYRLATSVTRAKELDRRTVYRYYRDCGPYGVDAAFVALADGAATWGLDSSADAWRRQFDTVVRLWRVYLLHREQVDPPPLVSGRDLISLGLPAGPDIGTILAEIREAQAVQEIENRSQALAYAQRWMAGHAGGVDSAQKGPSRCSL